MDASTLSIDDNVDGNVATSVCCPVAELSTLAYIDVAVRCSEVSPDITVRALSDTGAQVSIIKAELLDGSEMEVLGQNLDALKFLSLLYRDLIDFSSTSC